MSSPVKVIFEEEAHISPKTHRSLCAQNKLNPHTTALIFPGNNHQLEKGLYDKKKRERAC